MTDSESAEIRCERKASVLWIWIDREARRNAINPAVIAGIHAAVAGAAADRDLRATVLIGRVNGDCVAGGMGLMALCDLAIASDRARFGLPEVKVGVFPMQVLVLLRGMMHARHINELCLTGKLIAASRALEMGIVNEVVPPGELDARIEQWLAQLRSSSPAAMRRGKQAIFAMEMMAFHEALAFAEAQIAMAAKGADAIEGLAAFNEKRKPRWAEEGR